jgi:hypothetical protein
MSRRNLLAAVAAVMVAAVVLTVAAVVSHDGGSPSERDLSAGAGDTRARGASVPGYSGDGVASDPGLKGTALGAVLPSAEPPPGVDTPISPPAAGGRRQARTIAIADAHINPSGRLVVGYYVGLPTCYGQLGDIRIEQSGHSVTVTLSSAPDPAPSDTPCIDIAVARKAVIQLDRRLGGRTLIDGSTGEPVKVG